MFNITDKYKICRLLNVTEDATSYLSCLSLQTATMTRRFPRMLISMTRDRKQIKAIRFGMLSLRKWQKRTTSLTKTFMYLR